MIIAFDIDGTLLLNTPLGDTPNWDLVNFVNIMSQFTEDISTIIWSAGGADYAKKWANIMGLDHIPCYDKYDYTGPNIDFAFDNDWLDEKHLRKHAKKIVWIKDISLMVNPPNKVIENE